MTEGDQQLRQLVAMPDGGFVVLFQNPGGVAVRRFDGNAEPLGPDVQVNAMHGGINPVARAAVSPDGTLLVVWMALIQPRGFPEPVTGIVGQRLDASLQPIGPLLSISQRPYPIGSEPSVAAIGTGQFVVAWQDDTPQFPRGRVRLVGPEGPGASVPITAGTQYFFVPTPTEPSGTYVVAWYEPWYAEVRAQQFRGVEPTGPSHKVNSVITLFFQGPVLCTQPSGQIAVAWATDGDDLEESRPVILERVDREGSPSGTAFWVDPEEGSPYQYVPNVACSDGEVMVTWMEDSGPDTPRPRMRARLFDVDDTFRGELSIAIDSLGDAYGAGVTRMANGDWLIAWTDCHRSQDCEVYGQRYTVERTGECAGDCNGDRRVSIDELVSATGGALNGRPSVVRECLAADGNVDYLITIDELVRAVSRALGGCP
ncbi:hypothetical protein KF840_01300 [bacterium]|nr:hypothetical protein [bacterium]